MTTIDLRTLCSRYFTWADLIECGETWRRLQTEGRVVSNLPLRDETFAAIEGLARTLLDPLRERFGAVEITYGFAGPSLTKHIHRRISPPHDQHAGMEHNAKGALICARGGQSCDLRVPGVETFTVARWMRETLPFDSVYLYGSDRPMHLSYGATPRKQMIAMRLGGRARVPMNVSRRSWDDIERLLTPPEE